MGAKGGRFTLAGVKDFRGPLGMPLVTSYQVPWEKMKMERNNSVFFTINFNCIKRNWGGWHCKGVAEWKEPLGK